MDRLSTSPVQIFYIIYNDFKAYKFTIRAIDKFFDGPKEAR